MVQSVESSKGKKAITLEVSGLRSFWKLDAAGAPNRFLKEVLRVGQWTHPETGELIDITSDKLGRLVSNTQEWLKLGHKVHFPNGHTNDATKNLGWWLSIERDGDRALAVLEVPDAKTADMVGKTICDVSPGIWWDAFSSATGKPLDGGVLEHICATPIPVINDQPNFVRLAREVSMTEKTTTTTTTHTAPAAVVLKLDREAAKQATTLALSFVDAGRLLLMGGDSKASEASLVQALAALVMGEDDEEACGIDMGGTSTMSRKVALDRVASLEKDLASTKVQLSAEQDARSKDRAKRAEEKVLAAKLASVKLSRPIADEDLKKAQVLLAHSDPTMQSTGEDLLRAHLAASGSTLSRTTATLAHPDAAQADQTRLARHTSLAKGLRSQGVKVETDSKGFIVRTDGKDFNEVKTTTASA